MFLHIQPPTAEVETTLRTSRKKFHAMEVDAEGLVCVRKVGMAVHTPLVKPPIRPFQQHGKGLGDVMEDKKWL